MNKRFVILCALFVVGVSFIFCDNLKNPQSVIKGIQTNRIIYSNDEFEDEMSYSFAIKFIDPWIRNESTSIILHSLNALLYQKNNSVFGLFTLEMHQRSREVKFINISLIIDTKRYDYKLQEMESSWYEAGGNQWNKKYYVIEINDGFLSKEEMIERMVEIMNSSKAIGKIYGEDMDIQFTINQEDKKQLNLFIRTL